MEEIIDLIATDSSAAEISDKIKSVLFTKSAERIEAAKPHVGNMMFGGEFDSETKEEE